MRKILLGLVLLIFTSVNSFALDQQEAINNYLKGRQLDPIEGIWMDEKGNIYLVHKSGTQFNRMMINSSSGYFDSGYSMGAYEKNSSNLYTGRDSYAEWQESYYPSTPFRNAYTEKKLVKRDSCNSRLLLNSFNSLTLHCLNAYTYKATRVWPEKLNTEISGGSSKEKGRRAASGTAFFVNSKGNIVTNNHVIEGCSGPIKVLYNRKDYEAKIISKDGNLDLAVLSSDIKPNQYLKLSKKSGDKLDRVVAAGYPLGYKISDELKLSAGIVSATKGWKDNINEFQIDAALNPGNSGGPVVNDAGNLFGVAVAGLADRQNLNFAIKSKAVKDFLDVNKVSYSTANVEFDMDNKKRLKLLEDSTVFIYCN